MNTQEKLRKLLKEANEKNGFPAGTMESIVQQETGGSSAYLADPSKYHYGLNKQGVRKAGHTGKISTAFGLFGILESTGSKPGFGVAPLKDKSLEEQVRFASEYLGARVKRAGSLEKGIAGYGEGPAYAKQVLGRIPGTFNTPPTETASVLNLPDEQMQRYKGPSDVNMSDMHIAGNMDGGLMNTMASMSLPEIAQQEQLAQLGAIQANSIENPWKAFQVAQGKHLGSGMNYGVKASAPDVDFSKFGRFGERKV